jgi:uncharacterized membrane protein (DUF373 family)
MEELSMRKDRLTVFTKIFVDVMFWGCVAALLALPVIMKIYGRYNSYFADNYWPLLLMFYVTGVFAALIIYELRRMFRTVLQDDCFVEANVVSLKRMGTYSFIISAVTACRLFLYLTPAVLVVVLVFLIAGLFSKVLAQVFDRAVHYKLENDLTI